MGLEGVCKLFDNLLMGGKDYKKLAERLENLLARYREAGIMLASNKVQAGEKVSFAGYIINRQVAEVQRGYPGLQRQDPPRQ